MDELGELRDDDDYRSVRFERRYAAGPEAVWAALTDPAQLRRWLAEAVAFENEAGGSVALRFGDEPEQVVQGSILVYEPPRLLEYEWHWRGQTSSSVRFELTADSDGTLLVLDPADCHATRQRVTPPVGMPISIDSAPSSVATPLSGMSALRICYRGTASSPARRRGRQGRVRDAPVDADAASGWRRTRLAGLPYK